MVYFKATDTKMKTDKNFSEAQEFGKSSKQKKYVMKIAHARNFSPSSSTTKMSMYFVFYAPKFQPRQFTEKCRLVFLPWSITKNRDLILI